MKIILNNLDKNSKLSEIENSEELKTELINIGNMEYYDFIYDIPTIKIPNMNNKFYVLKTTYEVPLFVLEINENIVKILGKFDIFPKPEDLSILNNWFNENNLEIQALKENGYRKTEKDISYIIEEDKDFILLYNKKELFDFAIFQGISDKFNYFYKYPNNIELLVAVDNQDRFIFISTKNKNIIKIAFSENQILDENELFYLVEFLVQNNYKNIPYNTLKYVYNSYDENITKIEEINNPIIIFDNFELYKKQLINNIEEITIFGNISFYETNIINVKNIFATNIIDIKNNNFENIEKMVAKEIEINENQINLINKNTIFEKIKIYKNKNDFNEYKYENFFKIFKI